MKQNKVLFFIIFFVSLLHGMDVYSCIMPDTVQVNRDNVVMRFYLGSSGLNIPISLKVTKSNRDDKSGLFFIIDERDMCLLHYSKMHELDLKRASFFYDSKGSTLKLIIPKK